MRQKISSLTSREFKIVVDTSESVTEILAKLGYRPIGGNFKLVWARIQQDGLDAAALRVRSRIARSKKHASKFSLPLDKIMVKNSRYQTVKLKRRLLKEGLVKNACNLCGQLPEWQGKPLVLVLDHINGIATDHRRENLRLVCPNCESQLPTFRGRNASRIRKAERAATL